MSNFDSEDLRYFATLARTLNLAAAARLLDTSPATVLRRVRSLEQALNAKLFVRRRDGHRLTKAAQALAPTVREFERLLESVHAQLAQHDLQHRGRVRVATTEVGADWIMLPHMAQFIKDEPSLAIDIDTGPQAEDLLDDGDSIALRFRRPTADSIVVKKLGVMPFGLYATQKIIDHTQRKNYPLQQLPYISWSSAFAGTGMSRWIVETFDRRESVASLSSMRAHIDAARSGMGVVGIPNFIARRIPELKVLPISSSQFQLDAWLVIPEQARRIARIKAVARFITAAFEKSVIQSAR